MKKIRWNVNICIAVAVLLTWLGMTLFGQGPLSENGLGNLKYFTVQSNLLEGAASVIWLIDVKRNGRAGAGAERLKYIAAASVALTFTVVMTFLGPLYGYTFMLHGANLFFHLIIPVASILEIVFLSDGEYTLKDNNLAAIPPLIYGTLYLINILVNGIGEWPDTNDWYAFLAWGYPVGIVIFASICVVTWLLGLLMRRLCHLRQN